MRGGQKRLSLLSVTLVILSIFCFSLATLPESAMAWTYYVGGTGPGNFTTIQSAVDAAGWAGGIIYVYNGTYHEHVHVGTYSLSLIGENKNTTIIRGDQTGYGFRITNHHVHISGFTITNFSIGITFETYFEYHDIRNNTISDCEKGVSITDRGHDVVVAYNTISKNFVGIDLPQSTGNTIINNTISKNSIGINLPESTGNTIINNTIFSNRLDGIYLTNSKWNTISGNTIWDNWDGIYLFHSTNNSISNNAFLNNLDGIDLSYSSNDNTITSNIAMNNKYGIYVYSSDSNAIYHNSLVDNMIQAYENGTNSWDDDYPSGGNYWSDYTGVDLNSGPNQDLPGSDGMGDTAYDICGGPNSDRYPLVSPVELPLPRPPSAPRNLKAISGDEKVTLMWEPPGSDGGSAVANYRVYRGTTSGSETFFVEIGDVLKYVDTGLTNGQAYYYQVSAVNAEGEGGKSNEAMAIPTSGPTLGDPPHIVVNKSADPVTIWVEGSPASPRETTITLDVAGAGMSLVWPLPQDIVFVIDATGSMTSNDPTGLRLSAAKAYLDLMKPPDRAATVWFKVYGYLVNRHHLTSNYDQVKADINSIPPAGDNNNGSLGLRLGIDELKGLGNPDHTLAVILLSDGGEPFWGSFMMIREAQRAAEMGIAVYTIGLNPPLPEGEALLQQIASITGGAYYPAPTAGALADIYLRTSQGQRVLDIAGTKIEDSIEPNPMIRDVLPPFIHYVPGSFRDQNSVPCPPDIITANPDGSTFLDWDIEKILINQSWIVRYEVTSSMGGYVPVGVYPLSRVNYTKWDYSPESLPFPDVHVFVLDPGAVPQPLDPPFLRAETNQKDIILNWTSSGPNMSHYLIYRATDQREFDFSNPAHNTSQDPEPLRTNWTDVDASGENSSREYYYVVRAVSSFGTKSGTSNTVGKWTREFVSGVNAFSAPLEPFENRNISWYAIDIPNLNYIRWANSTGHWVTHIPGMGEGVNDKPLEMGEGYEASLASNTTYTFLGSPASMIRFQDGLGDSVSYKKSLSAQIKGNDINLSWEAVDGANVYLIFRSEERDGFHNLSLSPIAIISQTYWRDAGITGDQESGYYYMVIPVGSQGELGSSTYGVGVFAVGYRSGSDTFALPLEPEEVHSLDWYCDDIPNVVGIIHLMKGYWRLHAREMPEGVYDVEALQGEGYQISTDGATTTYTFVGY